MQHTGIRSYASAKVNIGLFFSLSPELTNVEFYCGKAEDLVPHHINLSLQNSVAIVDPPRAGLRKFNLKFLLRRMTSGENE